MDVSVHVRTISTLCADLGTKQLKLGWRKVLLIGAGADAANQALAVDTMQMRIHISFPCQSHVL